MEFVAEPHTVVGEELSARIGGLDVCRREYRDDEADRGFTAHVREDTAWSAGSEDPASRPAPTRSLPGGSVGHALRAQDVGRP